MNLFLEGLILQASLILALGAQNIFVLESGLEKRYHLMTAMICSLCDLILIFIGVLGAAAIFVQNPLLKISFGILGILFLFYYGVTKIKEGFLFKRDKVEKKKIPINRKKVIALSLAFSLLNPHVYLDTIILIGGYAAKFPELKERVFFGSGAGSFSVLWFFGLALFSSKMSSLISNPKTMQKVSLVSGIVLILLSFKLGNQVLSWL